MCSCPWDQRVGHDLMTEHHHQQIPAWVRVWETMALVLGWGQLSGSQFGQVYYEPLNIL